MRSILAGLAIVGAAFALPATDGMAQCSATAIPLPSQALLEPAVKISCDFRTSSLNDAEGQSSVNGQPITQPNSTLPMKLDYERQCYRHTEMILRSSLRRLQAAMGETIKAINKCPSVAGRSTSTGAKTGVPPAQPALLSSPSEFNCEFKNDSSDRSAVGPQSDASRSQSETNAEATLNMRLDYERQCYRHAALIAYDVLQRLQTSARETVKAVNSSRAAAKSSPSASPAAAARRPSLYSQASVPKQQRRDVPKSSGNEQSPCVMSGDRCIGRDPDPLIRSMMRIEGYGGF